MTLILDAMGSDRYPDPEIQAAIETARLFSEDVLLVGNETLLAPKLKTADPANRRVRIVDAPDILEMHEKPVEAAKRKPRNSMAVGLELIKTGEGQAFVSAGNTGGVMFNALRTLGRIKGVQRPALTAMFPTRVGHCVILDIGANADCRPDFLVEFAIMGSVYAEKVLGKSSPRVGLLSNGEEAGKGNQLVKDAYHLLENVGLNFIGNVEAKEVFAGEADVVVTDGFTGNVLLKSSEAVGKLITDVLKEEMSGSIIRMAGALMVKPAFLRVKKMMDPREVGAVPLLGIDGLVFVGHGRSDAHALVSAMKVAHQAVDIHLLDAIQTAIQDRLTQTEADSTH
ncbi:phosphate:acyl-[acyl carrier protein] acyltransferase [Longilinea arvoryzae]|uniref:Phosphate acyltransferase n=1 Tax=Longilinea arvoryzae TaxID=360412 RepID=A0A0S7BJ86_9CHLR|nr:phosphate acyltransferase PlsX [Longilinea arvoryzae]GAP14643.1 phosphate:acyl-[acyl carrier protein] acyltransferase [Longilinea arvoryzae]